MTPLRVFRKTTPLVNAIRLSLLPLARSLVFRFCCTG